MNFNNLVFKNICCSFLEAKAGAVAIIVGLMLFVIIAVLMMTVDLSRMQTGSINNQAAIDASALAAAEYTTRFRIPNNPTGIPTDLEDYAKKSLKQNIINDQIDATISQKLDAGGNKVDDFSLVLSKDNILTIKSCLDIKTPFASASGQGGVQKVCGTASSTVPGIRDVEIVLAIDTSNSMLKSCENCAGKSKIQALKESVTAVMDTYGDEDIHWALVPYNGMVDIGDYYHEIVADDFEQGVASPNAAILRQPANNLAPGIGDHLIGLNIPFTYQFNVFEDNVMDNFNRIFFDPERNPTENNRRKDYAVHSLIRLPLTSRQNDTNNTDPALTRARLLDDRPPVVGDPNTMFQAYWHHPYDFYLEFGDGKHQISWDSPERNQASCGTCYDDGGVNETIDVLIQGPPEGCQSPRNDPCKRDPLDPLRPLPELCGGNVNEGGVASEEIYIYI